MLPTNAVALLLSLPLALACQSVGAPPPTDPKPPERAIYSPDGGADADDCVETYDVPRVANCCRTAELAEQFIPTTEPFCWVDGDEYEAWRLAYNAAYFERGDCKAVHDGDACEF